MASASDKHRTKDTAKQEPGKMAGCKQADLHRREPERLTRDSDKRAKRANTHLHEQGGDEKGGK